jgi:hypothetical protein
MEDKTDLIKNNKSKLQSLNNKCISKRLEREFNSMYKLYDEIIIEESLASVDFVNVIVYELVDNKIVCYKFVINHSYPFICPAVFLNNQPYRNFLVSKTNYEHSNLKKLTGIGCFCCHSLTCTDNWSPRYTLNNIIDEIKHYKKIKKSLFFRIITGIIKRKYLIEDIDLISWLF